METETNDTEFIKMSIRTLDSPNYPQKVSLRKCPFCGGFETLEVKQSVIDGYLQYKVVCNWCGSQQDWKRKLGMAVAGWNTRAVNVEYE